MGYSGRLSILVIRNSNSAGPRGDLSARVFRIYRAFPVLETHSQSEFSFPWEKSHLLVGYVLSEF